MPLPDERPRQSVQNLIGRFEKRQTPNNTLSPRSSSVVSHHTGESVNHDIKEKREWPPKSIAERIASVDTSPVLPRTSLPTSQSAPQPLIPPMISEPNAAPLAEPSNKDQKLSTEPERKDDAEVPVAQPSPQATPTTPSRTTKSLTTKTSPILAHKSTARPPRQSMGPPTIPPLRPQHTGMSTTTTGSTRKSTVKSTSTVNPRTPGRPVAATASSPVTRPKTPSSGLFAHTAASLAKARNAAPPTPIPVKKATLSASSADRLSKPTAASLSRARTLAPPLPPVPATPKQIRGKAAGTPGPQNAGAKAKAMGPSSCKTQPLPKKETVDATPNAAAAVVEAEQPETNGAPNPVNGHSVKEPVEDFTAPTDPLAQETCGNVEASDATSSLEQSEPDSSLETPAFMTNGDSSHPHPSDPVVVEKDEVAKEPQGDDIESMVNLLESLPARPVSIAIIPDDVHEIPDEE